MWRGTRTLRVVVVIWRRGRHGGGGGGGGGVVDIGTLVRMCSRSNRNVANNYVVVASTMFHIVALFIAVTHRHYSVLCLCITAALDGNNQLHTLMILHLEVIV